MKKSISFREPSYDGEVYHVYFVGLRNFSIWHKADLWLLDLKDGGMRPIKEVNSGDTESFHNWAATPDGLCSVAHRRWAYIPSVSGKYGMGMGWWAKPFLCFTQENPWEYYDRSGLLVQCSRFQTNGELERQESGTGELSRGSAFSEKLMIRFYILTF